MSNEMTEWRRQMQAKFDNIMSGHKVNEDDRDWLRALLDARLRGEAAQGEHPAGEVYFTDGKASTFLWVAVPLKDGVYPLYTRPQPAAAAALSAAPATPDMPPKGKPFVGCQCPACGEEFVASAAPVPVACDDVRRLPPLPQAFFDEFGIGADDRVQDYARAALAQDRASQGAAPVAVAYDRGLILEMLGDLADHGTFTGEAVAEQIRLLREADDADAAGAHTAAAPSAPTQGAEREVGRG